MIFQKFRFGVWFNPETLQMFEVRRGSIEYPEVVELDVFGQPFSGDLSLVELLVKMSSIPCEYLGEV